jgi:hypothetical protein
MDVGNDLEVLRACQVMGEIVARTICAEHPELDVVGYTAACSAELFLAAQDMARCATVEAASL